MKTWTLMCLGAAGLAASGLAILPGGLNGTRLLVGPRDETATVDYVLATKSAADYEALVTLALANRDEDLAASTAALAERTGISLSPDLRARIIAAQAEAEARVGEDAWNGFAHGDARNEAALAGAMAADLTGVGDLRDLYQQGTNYLTGAEVDGLTVGLATMGLGLTAATVASLGLTLPQRAGVSTLKAMKRAGKLSPPLASEVGLAASSALDGAALKAVSTSIARLDLAAAREAAGRVLKPEALQKLKGLGSDVGTIGTNAGYRATVQTLGTARSTAEVGTIARLSARFGAATRAVVALGGTAFTIASLITSATIWSLTLIFWCCGALLWLGRLGFRIGRWIWPKPQHRLQAA